MQTTSQQTVPPSGTTAEESARSRTRAQITGFFNRYADAFFTAIGMELELVHGLAKDWERIAGRVRQSLCLDSVADPIQQAICRKCLREACQKAERSKEALETTCHRGLYLLLIPLVDSKQNQLFLVAGRNQITEGDTDAQRKSWAKIQAARELLELSLPLLRLQIAAADLVSAGRRSALISNACHFIEQNFDAPLNRQSIAQACQTSPDHLSHRFKLETGQTLSSYLCFLRLGHARYLLNRDALSITEICFLSGFQSVSQFNRSFRQHYGDTPSGFRRQLARA